ncbi:DUF4136 domain-containing protein [Bacteroidota bacterium]
MKIKIITLVLITSMGILVSCSKYPADVTRLQEDLVVYTQVDIQKDFNQFKTFAIVDSIAYVDDKDSGHILDASAKAVLDQIVTNMQNRGFTKVGNNDKPDLGITVSVIKTTNTTVYYPGWWWGYPGYYYPGYWGYPGYGYYYPYYPTYITSYSSGTLIIDMADFINLTPDKKIPIAWFAYIRALLTGGHTLDQITQSIDQAFIQSPQIQTTAK